MLGYRLMDHPAPGILFFRNDNPPRRVTRRVRCDRPRLMTEEEKEKRKLEKRKEITHDRTNGACLLG